MNEIESNLSPLKISMDVEKFQNGVSEVKSKYFLKPSQISGQKLENSIAKEVD